MRELFLYSRRGCHLCDELLDELEPLCRGQATVTLRDVDARPEWLEAYGSDVPVLCAGEAEICRHRLDRAALDRALKS